MTNNFDYIFFVFGFIFILLAIISWIKNEDKKEIFSWKILSIFAICFGLSRWVNVFFISFGDSSIERIIYYLLYFSAFLFLFEFSRRAWQKRFWPFLGYWLYLIVLVLLILSYFLNLADLLVILKYSLVFPASLSSGIILLIAYFFNQEKKYRFKLFLGLSLIFYFLNIYFSIFRVKFLSDFMNDWSFFDKTCIFVDSFSVVFLICAMLCFWFTEYKVYHREKKQTSNMHRWLVLVLLIISLLFGYFATNFRAKSVDDDLRYKIFFQVTKIAEQINPELVEELSFTESDLDSIYFQRIVKYLKDYSKIIGVKSIYSMALVDGNIVFGPESLEAYDDLASPPGTVYQEPRENDFEIFNNKMPYVIGPISDEYGSFITAAAPIISPKDGSVIMTVAMDINESDWFSHIFKKKIIVIGFVLLLLLIILFGSFLLNIRRKQSKADNKILHYLEGFFVAVILIYLTFFVSFLINNKEKKDNLHSFYELTDLHVYTPYQELKNIRKYQIASLGRLFENSESISLSEFHYFASPLLDFSSVNFFEWTPEVSIEEIDYFKSLAQENGLDNFQIFSVDDKGKKVSPGEKDLYYPVFYVEPMDDNREIIGFDISSNEVRLESINKSKETKLTSISDPIFLINDEQPIRGARISWPIFKNNQILDGFVSAVIYYDNIFNKHVNSCSSRDLFSEVSFYQYFDSENYTLLSSWPEKKEKTMELGSLNSFMDDKSGFVVTYPLFVFGETFFISVTPSRQFFLEYSSNLHIIFLIFGIIFSISISLWIGFLGSKNNILKEQVDLKTKNLRKKSLELNKKNLQLVEEKNKIETIVQGIGDGVFVVDKNLKIILFNQKSSELSGYSIEEALDKPYDQILKFVYEDSGKINDEFIKKALSAGEVQEMSNHTVLIRKDGSKISVADSAAPLKDESGRVVGCVVVFRDVTKEREVDVMKTEFINLTSHQLKTPLSTINWYLELILDEDNGPLNDSQKDFLDEISKSNKKMVNMVNSLLNISRLERGTFSFDPTSLSLIELTSEVLDEYKEKIKSNQIQVKTIFPKDLPKIIFDRKIIKIILQNLISNAIKYSPSGKKITIDILEDKSKKMININVSDQGYGIPLDQHSRVFEKLFRADNVKEKNIEGTGLGLYLVKIIVEKIGGSIRFDSQEGIGTTFQVSLPTNKNIKDKI